MIQQDAMRVLLENTGIFHYDGQNHQGRFSGTSKVNAIFIHFPDTGLKGRLAEGAILEEVFDHAICRAETMVRNLKKMKELNLETKEGTFSNL